MRQTATTEKIDPLTRIQEEINEVVRREQEYRRLTSSIAQTTDLDDIENYNNINNNDIVIESNGIDSFNVEKFDPLQRIQEEIKEVARREQEYRQLTSVKPLNTPFIEFETCSVGNNNNISKNHAYDNVSSGDVLETTTPIALSPTKLSMVRNDNNNNNNNQLNNGLSSTISNPSLSSSVNSKDEKIEEQCLDDLVVSGSSLSQINCDNNNVKASPTSLKNTEGIVRDLEPRYIGPNCYNMTPDPPQQKLTLTIRTPASSSQHMNAKQRQFSFSPVQKGAMQRFIASRGKLQLNNSKSGSYFNNKNAPTFKLNSYSALSLLEGSSDLTSTMEATTKLKLLTTPSSTSIISTEEKTPIERDAKGKPIRPGYVSVELKIQRELKDLKSRESELRRFRKTRQSTSNLIELIDNENLDSNEDEEDSDVEHCYVPGKLRSTKSISEFCDSKGQCISPSTSPIPDFDNKYRRVAGGMRPAVSLAQLCDLDPEEAPSSHRLIAQWESLIQQNA